MDWVTALHLPPWPGIQALLCRWDRSSDCPSACPFSAEPGASPDCCKSLSLSSKRPRPGDSLVSCRGLNLRGEWRSTGLFVLVVVLVLASRRNQRSFTRTTARESPNLALRGRPCEQREQALRAPRPVYPSGLA